MIGLTCTEVLDLKGPRPKVLAHLKLCKLCDPVLIVLKIKNKCIALQNIEDGLSSSIVNYISKICYIYPKNEELQALHVWFIRHSRSWDLKISKSKFLTDLDVCKSIIFQTGLELRYWNATSLNTGKTTNRYWPTPAYEKKHSSLSWMKRAKIKRKLTEQEVRNDKLFERSMDIESPVIMSYKDNPIGLINILEIMEIIDS